MMGEYERMNIKFDFDINVYKEEIEKLLGKGYDAKVRFIDIYNKIIPKEKITYGGFLSHCRRNGIYRYKKNYNSIKKTYCANCNKVFEIGLYKEKKYCSELCKTIVKDNRKMLSLKKKEKRFILLKEKQRKLKIKNQKEKEITQKNLINKIKEYKKLFLMHKEISVLLNISINHVTHLCCKYKIISKNKKTELEKNINNETERVCQTCLEVKAISSFNKNSKKCRSCRQEAWQKYVKTDKYIEARKRQLAKTKTDEFKYRNKLYMRKKRKEDVHFKLYDIMSAWIRKALKGQKNKVGWEKYVGYSLDDLRKHLQKQFKPGMNWKNYGKVWHVDHVYPKYCYVYNSYKDKAFKACWALNNLQPLLAKENLIKSNNLVLSQECYCG